MLVINRVSTEGALAHLFEITAAGRGLVQLPTRDVVAAAGQKAFGDGFKLGCCLVTSASFRVSGTKELAPEQLVEFLAAIEKKATVLMTNLLREKPGSG